jgi:glycosyltransferase involved in cell wall biosynthesis
LPQHSSQLVSVITPAFNAAANLAETIESCLDQTYERFELLIVDDGSTDGTAEVAARYQRRDTRVNLFRIQNRGVSYARNVALQHARGEFIALLDSDDVWMPGYLQAAMTTLARNPDVDIVTHNAINLGSHLDGLPYWRVSNEIRPLSTLDMIVRENAVHIMSVFRRRVIDRVGQFDEKFAGNEDYQFWLRAATAGCRFVADFAPRAYYRRRPDSASSDERRMLAGIMTVLREIRPLCPIGGPEIRAIDMQLRRFQRELLVAEARERVTQGDAGAAIAFLERIPAADRGAGLSAILKMASYWPGLLSYGYRARRNLRVLRRRSSGPRVRVNSSCDRSWS